MIIWYQAHLLREPGFTPLIQHFKHMQEVHDGVAARSGEKSMVKKLHSLLRTKKPRETKKRKSICQLKTIIFSFCIVFFCVFLLNTFCFFLFWVGWLLHMFHIANSLSPRVAPCFPFPNGKCRSFHTSRSRPWHRSRRNWGRGNDCPISRGCGVCVSFNGSFHGSRGGKVGFFGDDNDDLKIFLGAGGGSCWFYIGKYRYINR